MEPLPGLPWLFVASPAVREAEDAISDSIPDADTTTALPSTSCPYSLPLLRLVASAEQEGDRGGRYGGRTRFPKADASLCFWLGRGNYRDFCPPGNLSRGRDFLHGSWSGGHRPHCGAATDHLLSKADVSAPFAFLQPA